jgi:hypothetical protein
VGDKILDQLCAEAESWGVTGGLGTLSYGMDVAKKLKLKWGISKRLVSERRASGKGRYGREAAGSRRTEV